MVKKYLKIGILIAGAVSFFFPVYALDIRELAIQEITAKINALKKEVEIIRSQETNTQAFRAESLAGALRRGVRGDQVVKLQRVLGIAETGIFTEETERAVISYQKRRHLAADGIVGRKTRALLNEDFFPQEALENQPTAPRLSVSVSPSNSAHGFIISGGSAHAVGSQALATVLRIKFEVVKGARASVSSLTLRQLGASGNAMLDTVYLYESNEVTLIAATSPQALGTISFTREDKSPLFIVEGTKTVHVLVDTNKQVRWGEKLMFTINASSDILTDAEFVEGAFPLQGPEVMIITVSDLGRLQVVPKSTATLATAGSTNTDLFKFDFVAFDQDVDVRMLRLTRKGVLADNDVANIRLEEVGGLVPLARGIVKDNLINFGNGTTSLLVIPKGSAKSLVLKGDILGGAGKTFEFGIAKSVDILAYDKNYNVRIKSDTEAPGIFRSAYGTPITIGTSFLTVKTSAISPQGIILLGTPAALLGQFDLAGFGEDILLTNIRLAVDLDDDDDKGPSDIKDVTLFFDGRAVTDSVSLRDGSLDGDLVYGEAEGSSFEEGILSIATNLILPQGTTKTLSLVATVGSSGGALRPIMRGDAITVVLPEHGIAWEGMKTHNVHRSPEPAIRAGTLRVIMPFGQ